MGRGARDLKLDEFALTVSRSDGTTLILNDILSNVRHPKGLGANVMARLLDFGVKRPRTGRPVRGMVVAEPATVTAKIRACVAISDPRRISIGWVQRDRSCVA